MAIGGYKFRGYHYPARTATAGSAEEKAIFLDWFKCRLAAFKASCDASGALWRLLPACENTGDHDGSSWGNGDLACIHGLDDTGCNFGTFFQYGTENKYMAMVFTATITTTQDAGRRFFYYSNSVYYDRSFNSIAIDINPITPDNIFSRPAGRIPLSGIYRSWNTSVGAITVNGFGSGIYTGFSTKGTDIVEFGYTYGNIGSVSKSRFNWLVISPDAFSSLCSPTDIYHGCALDGAFYAYTNSSLYDSDPIVTAPTFLKNTGYIYPGNYSYDNRYFGIYAEPMGMFSGTNASLTFVGPLVRVGTSITAITSDYWINDDGILSKGTIRADLGAVNTNLSGNQNYTTTTGTPYAGGHYLCACILAGNSQNTVSQYQGAFYIGWDPSNPSILASTSWPDWPDAQPQS